MGCKGAIFTSGNSACCPDPQLVVEQQCMNFLGVTGTGPVLWTDNTGFNQVSVSAYVDSSASSAIITVNQPTGATSFGPIPPGDTVVQTFAAINSVTVSAGVTGSPTSGKVCLTTYRKVYP